MEKEIEKTRLRPDGISKIIDSSGNAGFGDDRWVKYVSEWRGKLKKLAKKNLMSRFGATFDIRVNRVLVYK